MKKVSMFLSALLGMALLTSPVSAIAEDSFNWYVDDSYTVECDAFKYSTTQWYGMTLETDVIDTSECDFMVSGICRNEDGTISYCVVNSVASDVTRGSGRVQLAQGHGGDIPEDVQIGDFLKCAAGWDIADVVPGCLHAAGEIEVVGNGVDIFGEEFRKVIRHELITAHPYSGRHWDDELNYFDAMPGDVTEDDELGITDVIKTNRYVLGTCQLGSYARLMADVDENGVVDSTDSLMILKEVVGLTENYVEVTE